MTATPSVTRLIATPVRSETSTRDSVGFADARLGGVDVLRHELRSTIIVLCHSHESDNGAMLLPQFSSLHQYPAQDLFLHAGNDWFHSRQRASLCRVVTPYRR